MLPVQKKMDYRSRGIANGDTGDETGAKGVPPNLFSLKNDIKFAFINRPIRSEDFECWKRLKVSATRPNPNNDKRWGDLHLSQFHGIRKWRIHIALIQRFTSKPELFSTIWKSEHLFAALSDCRQLCDLYSISIRTRTDPRVDELFVLVRTLNNTPAIDFPSINAFSFGNA